MDFFRTNNRLSPRDPCIATLDTPRAICQQYRQPLRFGAFIVLSLLIHALLFSSLIQWQHDELAFPTRETAREPISVRLLEAPQPQSPPQASTPATGKPRPRRSLPTPAIIAKSHPPPAVAAKPEQHKHQAKIAPAPAMDMMDMLNAARERRRRAEQNVAPENVQASGQESNDIALANINRDLQRQSSKWRGIGGVFQIISKGTRTAQFQFRGWNSESNNSWRQTINVDAGLNGDVELAIVQKMIALIRAHYNGDFNWESHRLGKVVVLSARPSDNAELEAFLMREFFGS